MISPVKTIIANMSDRACRLYLKGRSLYIISEKGKPGSLVEVEGDVFSRLENDAEAEFFLEQILRGYITISYSVDERFVCTNCIDNTNMNIPAKYIEEYRKKSASDKIINDNKGEESREVEPNTQDKQQGEVQPEEVKPEEVKPEEVKPEEVKPEEKQEEQNTDTHKETVNTIKPVENTINEMQTQEEKPKKTRKIKVQ